MTEQRYDDYRKSVDFIKRYIFPVVACPHWMSTWALTRRTDMQITDLRDIALDYAQLSNTGMKPSSPSSMLSKHWGLMKIHSHVALLYTASGFRERIIGTYQITMAKPYYRPT